jgi:hypothetical protein
MVSLYQDYWALFGMTANFKHLAIHLVEFQPGRHNYLGAICNASIVANLLDLQDEPPSYPIRRGPRGLKIWIESAVSATLKYRIFQDRKTPILSGRRILPDADKFIDIS